MNMNPSQYPRTVSSFFFVFILLFSVMAQAVSPQRIVPGTGTPLSKIVLSDMNLGVSLDELSKEELRELVRALDDPTRLIKSYRSRTFEDSLFENFFFSRFDLQKDSDALFTELFVTEIGEELKELPFEEAKNNWENFLNTLRDAKSSGRTQIEKTDLEAAAMSFVHQRYPSPYLLDDYLDYNRLDYFVDEYSMAQSFHNQFSLNHYISPYFTLTSDHEYHHLIMNMIWEPSFLKQGDNLSLIESKEFALKIWNDVTEEITRQGRSGITTSSFSEFVVRAVEKYWDSPGSSLRDQTFMKAMEEAARENDRLAQLLKTVHGFASNLDNAGENYRENLLGIIQKAAL